jgi:hypothetical protein
MCHQLMQSKQNFEATGSALETKSPGKRRTVHTPVMTALHCSPQCSACRHAVSLNIYRSNVQRILRKDWQFHPYKIQVLQ